MTLSLKKLLLSIATLTSLSAHVCLAQNPPIAFPNIEIDGVVHPFVIVEIKPNNTIDYTLNGKKLSSTLEDLPPNLYDAVSKRIQTNKSAAQWAKLLTPPPESPEKQTQKPNNLKPKNKTGGTINVNTATGDALKSVPGIGPRRASKIIGARGKGYKDLDDLQRRTKISKEILDEFSHLLTFE